MDYIYVFDFLNYKTISYAVIPMILVLLLVFRYTKNVRIWLYIGYVLSVYLGKYLYDNNILYVFLIIKNESIEHYYYYTIMNSLLLSIFLSATFPKGKGKKWKRYIGVGLFLYVILSGISGLSYGFYIDTKYIPLMDNGYYELCSTYGLEFYKQNIEFLLSLYALSFLMEHD